MMRRFRMPRRAGIAAVAAAAVIVLGLPTATTGAYLTSPAATATASAAVGSWCSVPNPDVRKNVYRLSDFPTVIAPESSGATTAIRMVVIPVVRDGSFAPVQTVTGAASGQLGVRLWSCTTLDTAHTNQIKLTSWRGAAYSLNAFAWSTPAPVWGAFASARLNPAGSTVINSATNTSTNSPTNPGAELRDLHRGMNALGAGANANPQPVTMRYNWLLDAPRTKTNTVADPPCSARTCRTSPGIGVTIGNSFSSTLATSPSSTVHSGASVTYLGEKFGDGAGAWGCNGNAVCPATNTRLQAAASNETVNSIIRDATGKIQWVVLEWWAGTAPPPADLEIEVFVAP